MNKLFLGILTVFGALLIGFTQQAYGSSLELVTIESPDGGRPFAFKILSEKAIQLTASVYVECDQDFLGLLVEEQPTEKSDYFEISYDVRAVAKQKEDQCDSKGKFIESSVELPLHWVPRVNFNAIQPKGARSRVQFELRRQ